MYVITINLLSTVLINQQPIGSLISNGWLRLAFTYLFPHVIVLIVVHPYQLWAYLSVCELHGPNQCSSNHAYNEKEE